MSKNYFIAFLVAALSLIGLLAACGGAVETPEAAGEGEAETQPAPAAEEAAAPAEETAPESAGEAETTAVVEEETEAETEPAQQAVSAPEVSCEPIEIPEDPLIAQVSAEEWALGPADAPITVIEYGDFQ